MAEKGIGKRRDVLATSVVVLLLTLIGAGVGFAVGSLLGEGSPEEITDAEANQPAETESESHASAPEPKDDPAALDEETTEEISSDDVILAAFPPVLTTLSDPKGKWIRLEGSVIVRKASERPPELLAEEAGEQILTYLRSVRLSQLESPSGMLGLRDDLDETVLALSRGEVRGVLIHGLVVE